MINKARFILLALLVLCAACVTYKNPIPTENPATLTAVIEHLTRSPTPKVTTLPTATSAPTGAPTPTVKTCPGLTAQECAHSGGREYTVAQELAFSDCLPVYPLGGTYYRAYVFTDSGLTIEGFEDYPMVRVAENVYEHPDPEYGYSWRFTFTEDSVIEDVPFTGNPCTQTTWTLIEP